MNGICRKEDAQMMRFQKSLLKLNLKKYFTDIMKWIEIYNGNILEPTDESRTYIAIN